jgi:glycosyltransferase involved in cell wall biosynthesis
MELNAPLVQQQAGYEKFPWSGLAGGVEGEILRGANGIIALSDWLKDWAVSHGALPEKIRVLPDGVNSRLFRASVSGAAIRARYGLEGNLVVGHVGSFHHWHDIAGLLDAFGDLYRRDPSLRLLLVGDGYERRAIQKRVEERGLSPAVVFTGNVPHEQVPEYLAAMDVSVVPYKAMPSFFFSPLKLFESMAAGTPTIAAALGQIQDVITHGETGWLYPAGDNARLAEGLAHLLASPDVRLRIGQAARQLILQTHTWDAITAEVVAIAERVLERKAPRTGA